MVMIKAGVRNELVKLFSLKKYRALLIVIGLLSLSPSLLGGVSKGQLGLSAISTPLTVLSIASKFMLPLIIAMAAADIFTAEQENGTIKAVIIRPISRISIFTTKVLAIVLYTLFALLVCFITSLILSIALKGVGSINILETLLAYTVSILPMFPVILFAVTVSQLCKSSSGTMMLSVFSYIMILAVGTIFPSISPMLFTSYTGWYKIFIGAAMPLANILNVLALLVAYALLFFAAGSWAFEKKEY